MLLKIIIILPIISICVNSIAPDNEPKYAVSTQSFHRDDVPLSYKYSSVHIYTTPQPEQRLGYHRQKKTKYNSIQYAPLEHQSNIERHTTYKHIPDQEDEHRHSTFGEHQTQYSTEGNGRDHLEPRLEAENLDAHNQNYRSYVPGHNVEVLQSNRVYGNSDLYRTYHKNFQDQKVKIPKFVIFRKKPEQEVQTTPENFGPPEQRPLSEEHNILYTFLPKPSDNAHNDNAIDAQKTFNQALYAKTPRLHLNIARVYGIAHMHPQAPVNIPHPNVEKPPSHTQAIFIPLRAPVQQKTILYPVQDINKNYPLHRL